MIGIGISTTPNRKILKETLPEWKKYMPRNAKLVIENDTEYTGVAATKNRLLAKLDDCEHIFLVDDDVKPLMFNWHQPYVDSPEPHLMYQFPIPDGKDKMKEIYRDDKLTAWSHTRGCFIYLHRSVLEIVGGFDEAYGTMYEHTDLSNRIHNAGLTTHRAADVVGSDKLLYCYDQDKNVESSIPEKLRKRNMVKNHKLYLKSKTSKEYMRYK